MRSKTGVQAGSFGDMLVQVCARGRGDDERCVGFLPRSGARAAAGCRWRAVEHRVGAVPRAVRPAWRRARRRGVTRRALGPQVRPRRVAGVARAVGRRSRRREGDRRDHVYPRHARECACARGPDVMHVVVCYVCERVCGGARGRDVDAGGRSTILTHSMELHCTHYQTTRSVLCLTDF